MRKRRTSKYGFTLIELLVVISIIALLIAILLPSLAKAKELANRAVCSANIRSIIQSMTIYAQSNNSQFPTVVTPNSTTYQNNPGTPTNGASTSAAAVVNSIYATPYQRGSPLACMWLMVLQGQITPKSFICPSDPIANQPSAEFDVNNDYYSNFGMINGTVSTTGQGESYSIAFPWNYINGASEVGGWWNTNNATSDLPLVSDMAPTKDTAALANTKRDPTQALTNTYGPYIYNSGNHNGAGQNVGFGDDHVTWETDPYIGQNQDNIFTFGATGTTGGGTVLTTGAAATAPSNLPTVPPFDVVMAPVRDVATGAW